MIFMDNDHAQRWAVAIQTAGAVRDGGAVNPDFGASLYILTGLPGVYDRVEKHVHHGYIDFEPMLNIGLSTGERVLVSLAGNLYNGGYFRTYTPHDIVSDCDGEGVTLATKAILLRKAALNINTIFDWEVALDGDLR